MKYTFKVYRFNPETDDAPRYQTYEVDCEEGWTVLDALNYIKWYLDGSVSYRRSCRHEICGSCAVMMNGKNGLLCNTQVKDLGSKTITIEPLKGFPVLKDLIVDMDLFIERLKAVNPFFESSEPPTDREYYQSPEDRAIIDDAVNCILCGSCTGSCPSFWYNPDYLGPAALFKAFRFVYDSRDTAAAERLELVDDHNGLWRCHTIFNCMECCPKNLNITEGIQYLKRLAFMRKI
ncbi:MAG: succinate dehydrogenase iron-sulfur subunit [Deltaproteobacteria bacterium]|nr:MAG: succinate dehydrogenase iron-sulfur subunit [Deltaproteobacteria bacterium]